VATSAPEMGKENVLFEDGLAEGGGGGFEALTQREALHASKVSNGGRVLDYMSARTFARKLCGTTF